MPFQTLKKTNSNARHTKRITRQSLYEKGGEEIIEKEIHPDKQTYNIDKFVRIQKLSFPCLFSKSPLAKYRIIRMRLWSINNAMSTFSNIGNGSSERIA